MIDSIRQRWEFELLRSAGRYRRSGPLGLRSALDDEIIRPRVAFAIGRSVGNAVVRNTVRRRLRAILRDLDAVGVIPRGRHLIIASPQAATASYADLNEHLSLLLNVRAS